MPKEDFFNEITNSFINLEREKALSLARKAITDNMDVLQVIEKGFGSGIKKLGELWDAGDIFLPELMLGGKIMQEALEILLPKLKTDSKSALGKIVIATIEGDIHSIGKTIVGTMLSANGFDVLDLGADVPAEKIVDKAVDFDADIIGVSALLTTTMTGQKQVIDILNERNLRNKFKVILGGAPISESWTRECGADGYAANAIEAVKLVKKILKK
jgi:corrinoid protein of di/trimethylamine methyltransferase